MAVSNGYYDAAGNQGAAASATFTVDTTGPAAPTFSPADGATATDAGTNITLTFAEAVRRRTATARTSPSPTCSGILTLKRTNASGTDVPYAASIDARRG